MKNHNYFFLIAPLLLASCVTTTPEPRTKTTVINGANGSKVILTTECNSKEYSIGVDNKGGVSGGVKRGDCIDGSNSLIEDINVDIDANVDFDPNKPIDSENPVDEKGNPILF